VGRCRSGSACASPFNNAAKYTPSGGRITSTAERRGNEVEVGVSDNGNGIPTERLESIFDMFTQIESPISDHQGGLGIGLSLAKGLVTLHHGKIEAHSEGPGRGSEFRVRLPAGATRVVDSEPPKSAEAIGAKLKILIVDDNRDVAASLAMLLQLMGHEVRLAYDGETAVRLADEFRPQTMLVDTGMPGLDGYGVCRRIRDEALGKGITLIAVTGWGQDEDRWRSASSGFDAHLVKPVNPETLQAVLSNLRSTAALERPCLQSSLLAGQRHTPCRSQRPQTRYAVE
jgi:CheY-like chemotaxis protein